MHESVLSYQAFYQSEVSRALKSEKSLAGLIEVNGPTGLGKTSALVKPSQQGTEPVLSYLQHSGLQAIFVTHRWNILQGLIEDVTQEGYPCSVLYPRQEQICAALQGKALRHEKQDAVFGDWRTHIGVLADKHLWVNDHFNLEALQYCCSTIEHRAQRLERIKSSQNPDDAELAEYFERELGRVCAQFEQAIIQNLEQLEKLKREHKKTSKGKRRNNTGADYAEVEKITLFRQNELIRRALPGIAWKDDNQPLLVMTTHKFFNGFFDGRRQARMGDAALSGYVVFIDEFEYQEPVLLDLLSQAQRVQELPQCLGVLIDEGKRLIARARITHAENDSLHEVLEDLDQNFEEAVTDLADQGIGFPAQRALVKEPGIAFKPRYLFQSDYTITQLPTFLVPRDHGLEIVQEKTSSSVTAGFFLSRLERLLRKTLQTLSMLPVEQQVGSGRSLYDEFMHLLFNSVNDYQSGHYHQSLNNAIFKGAVPNTNLPELAEWRKTNVVPHTQAHIHGFSCWMFAEAKEQLDRLRIVQKRAHIPTTPEALLVSLASRNLVFGLSATSMIDRSLGNFDLKWVYRALTEIADKRMRVGDGAPIPTTPNPESVRHQQALISHLKKTKGKQRKNQLAVEVCDFTSKNDAAEIAVALGLLTTDFFQAEQEVVAESTREYRYKCLFAMLSIIGKAADNEQHRGHLAFVNSIRYLRKWLESDMAFESRQNLAGFSEDLEPSDRSAIPETLFESPWFKPVVVRGRVMILCLLTAESQKSPGFTDHYAQAFRTPFNVVVITQVASATNGINLDFAFWEDGTLKKSDLTCLYLYEARHFYFSVPEAKAGGEQMATIGAQIRQVQKLRQSAQISELDYRHYIGSLMVSDRRQVSQLNNVVYKATDDYVSNLAADVQQQVGRLERVWDETPETKIYIQTELANSLSRYAQNPHAFSQHRSLISSLNEGLLDTLASKQDSVDPLKLLFAPIQDGNQIRKIIDDHLVGLIRHSREAGREPGETKRIKHIWDSLGRAALRRDLACSFDGIALGLRNIETLSLKDWACIRLPIGADPSNGVWQCADGRFLADRAPESRLYSLKPLYRWISHHEAIVRWFNNHGYATSPEVSSGLEEQFMFHPHFAQRILQGRIGEESIRGLFDHESITCSTQLLHDRTLELYDFHIVNTPLFIDAKFWGLATLRQADEVFQGSLTNVGAKDNERTALAEKVLALRKYLTNDARLVIANLVGSDGDAALKGFDLQLNPMDVNEAPILVLSSCIHPHFEHKTTPGFAGLCELARRHQTQTALNQPISKDDAL
ncbi:hypothetical protein [Marinobacterium sp. MBR-109]|jgi:hypothetical protein|uniref:hypothetical protein n=1 Tax=Marinobacterium sp. MBR-109 TaxID=3156462 RepID=UPI003397075F